MEDELCFTFYTMLCCSLCCAPPLQQPLSSRPPQGSQSVPGSGAPSDVVIENPSSPPVNGENKTLKNEQHLK